LKTQVDFPLTWLGLETSSWIAGRAARDAASGAMAFPLDQVVAGRLLRKPWLHWLPNPNSFYFDHSKFELLLHIKIANSK
jgi:hypothetical protein